MKNKRFSALLLCAILLFTSNVFAQPEEASDVTLNESEFTAPSYILINLDNGEVLKENNPDKKMYPASTTKIMTAMIALGKLDLEGESTVSNNAVMSISWDSSKLGLYEGEAFNNYELIKGMMVVSGNDAANVLAESVSGSVSDFVALMNTTAKELGCTGTNFTNAHGLTDENHYTTASDMAKIAKKAMENPDFREIVKTTYFELPKTDKCDTDRVFYTTNNLLTDIRTSDYLYSPAIGIKTGYTDAARNCLVAAAEKDGVRLLTVVFGASVIDGVNRAYTDAKALMEWGFDNFKSKTVIAKGEIADERSIKHAKKSKTVKLMAKDEFTAVLSKDADESLITKKITVNMPIIAPVTTEDELGKMEIFYNGELLGSVELTADKTYEYSWWSAFIGTIGKIIGIFVLIILGAVIILIIVRQVEYEKRKKERVRNKKYRER